MPLMGFVANLVNVPIAFLVAAFMALDDAHLICEGVGRNPVLDANVILFSKSANYLLSFYTYYNTFYFARAKKESDPIGRPPPGQGR